MAQALSNGQFVNFGTTGAGGHSAAASGSDDVMRVVQTLMAAQIISRAGDGGGNGGGEGRSPSPAAQALAQENQARQQYAAPPPPPRPLAVQALPASAAQQPRRRVQ